MSVPLLGLVLVLMLVHMPVLVLAPVLVLVQDSASVSACAGGGQDEG